MARGGAFEAQAPGMRRSCRSSSATLKHHMSRWPRYGRHGIRGLEHQKDSRRGERLPLWGKTPVVGEDSRRERDKGQQRTCLLDLAWRQGQPRLAGRQKNLTARDGRATFVSESEERFTILLHTSIFRRRLDDRRSFVSRICSATHNTSPLVHKTPRDRMAGEVL